MARGLNIRKRWLMPIGCCISVALSAQQKPHGRELVPVTDFGKSMAIGLSVNSENRIFVSFPNYNGDGNLTLAEVKNGRLYAYPNNAWNRKDADYSHSFLRVQDLYVDAQDHLWVLDSQPAPAGDIFGEGRNVQNGRFKLVKINTRTNRVERVYLFDDLDKSKSALNDMQVDTDKDLAYLSDPGQAAIVVLDLKTETSRLVLQNSTFTLADGIVLKYDGMEMKDLNGKPFSSHVNGIALTKDFRYFYFKPINKENLFRIETRYLADASLSEKELERKVEDLGKVGITHGLIADAQGNVYLTTSESYSISYLAPDGELHTLVEDPRLLWPDSLGIGTDGYLYFTCSQLQRLPQWNNGEDKTEYPYRVFKVKLP
ncbi:MAG: L-dopachrome tautomerase-related protein [Breznakibacter sp.]